MALNVNQSQRLDQFDIHDDANKNYGKADGVLLLDPAIWLPYSGQHIQAWSTTSLAYVDLTVDATGKLNVTSGGGGRHERTNQVLIMGDAESVSDAGFCDDMLPLVVGVRGQGNCAGSEYVRQPTV